MTRLVYLSRTLRPGMPTYNGRDTLRLKPESDMRRGDTTNSLEVTFGNHTGTHFDFPRHFWVNGKTLNDYPADFFFFKSPCLIDIPVESGRLITAADLAAAPIHSEADILLIRTGYG